MQKRTAFNCRKHEATADILKGITTKIGQVLQDIYAAYPVRSRSAKAAERALDAVGKLRSALDEVFLQENPDAQIVYFGDPRRKAYPKKMVEREGK